jgi:mono/diheme cytochrome c family protein
MKTTVALIGAALMVCAVLNSCKDTTAKGDHADASMAGGSSDESFKVVMTPEAISAGHILYQQDCSACHGMTGQGNGPAAVALATKPRDHTNGAYMDKLSNRHLYNVIKMGGSMYGFPAMPAQPQLKDEEIGQLIAYVRTLSNNYKKQ